MTKTGFVFRNLLRKKTRFTLTLLSVVTAFVLFGLLHEHSHGWALPFAFLALCVGVMLCGARLACRPAVLEDRW